MGKEDLICRWEVLKDIQQTVELLDKGVDPNSVDADRSTPLILAAMLGSTEVVQVLLEYGACMDASNSDGWTALMYAAQQGHANIVRLLVSMGCQVSCRAFYLAGWLTE